MIPYLMDHTKTLKALMEDRTNGLGPLSEATEAAVTQERNGEFTLQIRLPMTAKHFRDVTVGGIVKAKADEESPLQMFRIQKISKPISGVVTISANHISYDLGKTSVLPFQATGTSAALAGLKSNMQSGSAFTFWTDIENTTSVFTNKIPQSLRALLGGQQGSILDVYGGEFEFDNTAVKLHANRGRETGVVLRYGKNITDLKQEENIENTFTAVQPYAIDAQGNAIVGTLQTVIQSAEPRIMNLDLSAKFDTAEGEEITVEQLNTYAQQYISANNIGEPKVNITVSFIALWQTEEYKTIAPLERLRLCDTVTVEFEKLGINATAKVVGYKYNVLAERYDSIEVGEAKSNLARTISGITQEAAAATESAAGYLDGTIQMFTSLMAQGLGLFVTREPVGETGGTRFYLHNKPTRAASQYQWTFNSNGFFVSQDYGQTWSAGIDAQGNAVFNSLSANQVDAMTINGSTINGSQFNSESGNLTMALNAAMMTLRYQQYLRYLLFQNNGVGVLELYDGNGTDILTTPASGSRLTVDPHGLKYRVNGAVSDNFGLYFSSDGLIIGNGNGRTVIRIGSNGQMDIQLNNVRYNDLQWVDDGNGHSVLGR